MKTIGIIQARMGSTRLPGKVLLPLGGRPVLEWVVQRAIQAKMLDTVVVATSELNCDNTIVDWAERHNIHCFRGSEEDVLDRFYRAASIHMPDAVVRLTADNPIVDGALIDRTVGEYQSNNVTYAAAKPSPDTGFPLGVCVEVFSYQALTKAVENAEGLVEREHVTPYIYTTADDSDVRMLQHDQGFGSLRLTLDTESDYELLKRVFMKDVDTCTPWETIAGYVMDNDEWQLINCNVYQERI